jgi:hypothetical protein
MPESEIAHFRQHQALEYEAAQRGLNGFAIVARHESITARMEIGAQRLLKLIEEGRHEEAQAIMNTPTWEVEGLENLPDTPTRGTLVDSLRRELDHTEEAATLIEYIQQIWEIIDALSARFASERARKIIETPSSLLSETEGVNHG